MLKITLLLQSFTQLEQLFYGLVYHCNYSLKYLSFVSNKHSYGPKITMPLLSTQWVLYIMNPQNIWHKYDGMAALAALCCSYDTYTIVWWCCMTFVIVWDSNYIMVIKISIISIGCFSINLSINCDMGVINPAIISDPGIFNP